MNRLQEVMILKFVAHIREDGTEQELDAHLKNTAQLAGEFAKMFNNQEYAYICGLLHDIGKYSDAFQKRIKEDGKRCDHSTAGARVIKELCKSGKLLSYCIAGHHGGLPNHGSHSDMPKEGTLCSRITKSYVIPPYDAYKDEIFNNVINLKPAPNLNFYDQQKDIGMTFYMFIKMIYSCLTDSDYLDTEYFMRNGQVNRKVGSNFNHLLEQLNKKLQEFEHTDGIINEKRKEILNQCITKANSSKGLFTLTVPTGGGKTLSSMAFALNHLLANKMSRIIYIIPYTSIIEQNAKVFSDLFGNEIILEHHSNYDFTSNEDDFNEVKKLASQNWDMPIVITTNVQFFESMFSNKSSRLRKLHNIANSIIIFDEAQMLPIEYMSACTKVIGELVYNYGCTAVLCSATQPAIMNMFPKEIEFMEICENTKELYEIFKRTIIINRELLITENLAEEMNKTYQCLTIVNTRRHAKKVYSLLEGEGVYHLSTLMCPAHRANIIKEIKIKLKNNLPCKVVSTRLIEAGVDVDFPRVYRAYAGLDSIIQSAGRANREGKLKNEEGNLIPGQIHIFQPEDEYAKKQPGNSKLPIEITHEITRNFSDITSPEAIDEYFKKLYFYNGEGTLDSKEIIKRINEGVPLKAKNFEELFIYPFEDISRDFKLMEEETYSVIIPFNDEVRDLLQRLKYSEFFGDILRALQRYSVNIYETEYNKLFAAGKLEFYKQDIAVLRSIDDYNESTGINIDIESGIGIFV
jgi:CRISPR-associated helicase Cas3/CRISPR-associated endonuclease Cas3-HD